MMRLQPGLVALALLFQSNLAQDTSDYITQAKWAFSAYHIVPDIVPTFEPTAALGFIFNPTLTRFNSSGLASQSNSTGFPFQTNLTGPPSQSNNSTQSSEGSLLIKRTSKHFLSLIGESIPFINLPNNQSNTTLGTPPVEINNQSTAGAKQQVVAYKSAQVIPFNLTQQAFWALIQIQNKTNATFSLNQTFTLVGFNPDIPAQEGNNVERQLYALFDNVQINPNASSFSNDSWINLTLPSNGYINSAIFNSTFTSTNSTSAPTNLTSIPTNSTLAITNSSRTASYPIPITTNSSKIPKFQRLIFLLYPSQVNTNQTQQPGITSLNSSLLQSLNLNNPFAGNVVLLSDES
ncbi:hypothetical protein O181_007119 [Austropuccinia psidii MF-1]|uniref:Uncharacterized protein n=1 Tax=Austropuccinia psidii MF-1 TaxID=1389203 RepID=A0A9Q3BLC0_9BASI|nr:hypothetical protein [Austropuccinia psidii MF-1]